MNYPKNMHEATQAAHEERSKAFFELLGWFIKPVQLLLRPAVLLLQTESASKPAPPAKGSCAP